MSRGRPGGRAAQTDDAHFTELEAIYRDVEASYQGSACEASTDCCHFERTGREPYVTSVELAYLLRGIRRAGGVAPAPADAKKRRLPTVYDEGRCPVLGADGRCRAYAARPIGCRTFWCERATHLGDVRHRDVSRFVRRIQEVAARHLPGGDAGRTLRKALELVPPGQPLVRW